jgi:Ni,Fe-hydrogenase I large subunit
MRIAEKYKYWEVMKRVLDPETREVVKEHYVAQVDIEKDATMLYKIFVANNKDPNIEYYIREIPEPHPLHKHTRKQLNLP